MKLERELQLYDSSKATCDLEYGFDVDEPHILFDVNLEGAMENFLHVLDEYYQPDVVLEQYQDDDEFEEKEPLFVFGQAIDRVLALDSKYHNAATDIATENMYGHDPSAFNTWQELAAAWLGQYLNGYNQRLASTAPDYLDDLHRVITELRKDDSITTTEIITIVKHDLGLNPYEGRY